VTRVLFVCLGNICRSPTAAAVLRAGAARRGLTVEVDSAGTDGWHSGEGADPRSAQHAAARGYDLSAHRARAVTGADFERFDLLLAMDRSNRARLDAACPASHRHKVRLALDFATEASEREVPDPYREGPRGFEHVLDLLEDDCRGLLDAVEGGVDERLFG
jgi:protein-tyrosine phosphatase